MRTTIMPISSCVVLLAACGTTAPPHYVRAQRQPDPPPRQAIVQVPTPLPLPGQLRPMQAPRPSESASGAKHRLPADIIRAANRKATSTPDPDGYFNAIMTYDFISGALYQVYTAPMRLTDIQLQPGEQLVGKPATGDSIRWILGRGTSSSGAGAQQHIYVKPTRPDLDTTIAINTDKRSYLLELHSYPDTYMAAVAWRYPQDELAQLEATSTQEAALAQATTAANITVEALNFGYSIVVKNGHPSWTPTQVFDDGKKTYIRFPPSMATAEMPVLFVVSSTNESQLVNYRSKNLFMIVDRLFQEAELRLGQTDQEVVRLIRGR
jgi:P-type conjugative transfer protein TrbG